MSGMAGTLLPATVTAVMALMSAGMLVAFLRVLLGPTHLDRVVALDLIGILAAGLAAVNAIRTGQEAFLDVAIVMALIAFLGTVALAYLIEWRGKH
jgi:multicomponent Na+:H+ antiporter subunit F